MGIMERIVISLERPSKDFCILHKRLVCLRYVETICDRSGYIETLRALFLAFWF